MNKNNYRFPVGIDLGTTNSVLATINEKANGDIVSAIVDIPRAKDIYAGRGDKLKFASGREHTLPSVIYYCEEDGYKPIVGDLAKIKYPLRPHLVAKSIKSQMSNPKVKGLAYEVPDKTPAEVASRILQHMLNAYKKQNRIKEIDDAVITVPANFDPSMCKATLDAAEIAGLKTKYPNGMEKPMLLSEPNAVIYDLYNQIKNGELSANVLNLNKKQNIMVFDLGGGTLDITFHKVSPSNNVNEPLNIEEIATNRYTLLGGDDFDYLLAENMYERYLDQYKKYPSTVRSIRRNKETIMPELIRYAESLKIDANEKFGKESNFIDESSWDWFDDSDDENYIDVGGSMNNGYAYDDSFTKDEIENIYSEFMGNKFGFDDYKRINGIDDTKNIIYPILDVLAKAARLLGDKGIEVDNVILNGGMTKFYMVRQRIKDFFGFEPLVTMDPDLSVARGAAVYHHILLNSSEVKSYMQSGYKKVENKSNQYVNPKELIRAKERHEAISKDRGNNYGLQMGRRILNETLYLGLKNGGAEEIIVQGSKLPYNSDEKRGYRIAAGQTNISLPIKVKQVDGNYKTIANGRIDIKKQYKDGAYVSFILTMSENKVITLNAWISLDDNNLEIVETASCSINIELDSDISNKNKLVAPTGTKLNARAEISHLLQMCNNLRRAKKGKVKEINGKIKTTLSSIYSAGNKEDFAEPVLEALGDRNIDLATETRLFVIARKIGDNWSKSEKRELSRACMYRLDSELYGFSCKKNERTRNAEIIRTLSVCGSENDIKKIRAINNKSYYKQSCIYLYGKTGVDVEYLKRWFYDNIRRSESVQETAYFLGIAYRKDQPTLIDDQDKEDILDMMLKNISFNYFDEHSLVSSIFAVGFICDQRFGNNSMDKALLRRAANVIKHAVNNICLPITINRPARLALKMIAGEILLANEEKFLLEKINA